ncbi:hypothetical protein [Nocardia africana]|uniref:Uncharacterized protein n=1 Tax=Nocardia africana TaxID=134964 RepID=A0A378WPE2_9NOCA|nr:hypothetical protein [Nocardia africana]MCC3315228.1 hypothetical protein [Nocardia africana]SUA42475.1 Uncharacterised protein [Nocardia africana]
MTHGQDGVIESNGLPGTHGTASGADSAVPATPGPSRIEVRPLGRIGMPRRLRPARTGMRPSTLALITVWIAVLALYLAVRPGG